MTTETKTTVKRKGVHLSLAEVKGEWRLLQGNKILSRHATENLASHAYDAERAARIGRHTLEQTNG